MGTVPEVAGNIARITTNDFHDAFIIGIAERQKLDAAQEKITIDDVYTNSTRLTELLEIHNEKNGSRKNRWTPWNCSNCGHPNPALAKKCEECEKPYRFSEDGEKNSSGNITNGFSNGNGNAHSDENGLNGHNSQNGEHKSNANGQKKIRYRTRRSRRRRR